MSIVNLPSPNFDSREKHPVDMMVLHYTGMKSGEEARRRLTDPASKVSAHYVVEEDGTVYALVEEDRRAWHAGLSSWRGHSNINQRSVGIEIVNPGHEFGYRPFPAAQMKAVTMLARDVIVRHKIEKRNVVGHSDIAPTRKEDPGELFEWQTLAKLGVGLWPAVDGGQLTEDFLDPSSVIRHLSAYGYDVTHPEKTIIAFQRHFRQKNLSGQWDEECARLLAVLLAMV